MIEQRERCSGVVSSSWVMMAAVALLLQTMGSLLAPSMMQVSGRSFAWIALSQMGTAGRAHADEVVLSCLLSNFTNMCSSEVGSFTRLRLRKHNVPRPALQSWAACLTSSLAFSCSLYELVLSRWQADPSYWGHVKTITVIPSCRNRKNCNQRKGTKHFWGRVQIPIPESRD